MARNRYEDDDEDDRPRRRRRDDEDDDDDRPRRRRRDDDDPRRISAEDLRAVAWSQKAVMLCILAYLATLPASFALSALPDEIQFGARIGQVMFLLIIGITSAVFVFMMALKVYTTGVGVVLGLLTLIPCIGLIVLVIINSKATSILRANGVRVGLLGAEMSDLP
jgi:hypothetical protein